MKEKSVGFLHKKLTLKEFGTFWGPIHKIVQQFPRSMLFFGQESWILGPP